MITYKKCRIDLLSKTVYTVMRFNDDDSTSAIQFNLSNMDYQNFKKQIEAGTAQLENIDGNLMTEQEARNYIKELP